MLPQPGVATTSRIPISIRRFPWIRPFVADYAYDFAKVAEFFAGDPGDQGTWREAIARTQQHQRQRDAIAEIVLSQQLRREAPAEARAAAARLHDPNTVAVITGQQAGLFGGPLFTLLKAITAIELAAKIEQEHGVPAVAVFWIDAEDHDWNEVKSCGVLDSTLMSRTVAIGDPEGAHNEPVAHVRLDQSIERALDDLGAVMPRTESSAWVYEALTRAYHPGAGMADAFGRWLETVLGSRGLIVYDSADRAAKPLVAHVFAAEIERAGETSRLAAEAGAAMEARGYSAQVTPPEGGVALFHLDGMREAIRLHGDQLQVGSRSATKAALSARAREAPAEFSPNVLLRPIVQDTLFPTVSYVAGPNELVYLGQLRHVYESFGVPMPLMYQRATATIVDTNAARFLLRHDVPLDHLRARDEAALNQLLALQLPPEIETSLDDVSRMLDARMEQLAHDVAQIDATLEGATRSALGRMRDDLKKLHAKIIQAAKRKDETLRRQFQHAQAQAFPGGEPQERAIGFVYFLNKYGPALVDRLVEDITLEMGTHWVVTI